MKQDKDNRYIFKKLFTEYFYKILQNNCREIKMCMGVRIDSRACHISRTEVRLSIEKIKYLDQLLRGSRRGKGTCLKQESFTLLTSRDE